jgi:hypothetical protein
MMPPTTPPAIAPELTELPPVGCWEENVCALVTPPLVIVLVKKTVLKLVDRTLSPLALDWTLDDDAPATDDMDASEAVDETDPCESMERIDV